MPNIFSKLFRKTDKPHATESNQESNIHKMDRALEEDCFSKEDIQDAMPWRAPAGVINPDKNRQIASRLGVTLSDATQPIGRQALANNIQTQMMGQPLSGNRLIRDGLTFRGYPWLAEMGNRAELRNPCDVIADECGREWIEIRAKGDTDGTLEKKIDLLTEDMERFNVRRVVRTMIWQALIYGMSHVYIDDKSVDIDTDEGTNLPLRFAKDGFKKGQLGGFKNVDPCWVTPTVYNATNPLKKDWYISETWWCLSKEVHRTRLKQCVPYPVSDLLKPSFNFGGLSLTQQISDYVDNFLRMRNSIAQITANSSMLCLGTKMLNKINTLEATWIGKRAALAKRFSEGQGQIVYDKEAETANYIAAPLTGYTDIYAKFQEAIASIPGIPFVKLFGQTPSGLNASSEGEIKVWYDKIKSIQEAHIRPILQWMLNAIQINRFGEIDHAITFDFSSLWQTDDEKEANIALRKAQTDQINLQEGKITADEARERESNDEDSLYRSVDLSGDAPGRPDDLDMEDPTHNDMPAESDEAKLNYE